MIVAKKCIVIISKQCKSGVEDEYILLLINYFPLGIISIITNRSRLDFLRGYYNIKKEGNVLYVTKQQ